jgi:hypothetical protein
MTGMNTNQAYDIPRTLDIDQTHWPYEESETLARLG